MKEYRFHIFFCCQCRMHPASTELNDKLGYWDVWWKVWYTCKCKNYNIEWGTWANSIRVFWQNWNIDTGTISINMKRNSLLFLLLVLIKPRKFRDYFLMILEYHDVQQMLYWWKSIWWHCNRGKQNSLILTHDSSYMVLRNSTIRICDSKLNLSCRTNPKLTSLEIRTIQKISSSMTNLCWIMLTKVTQIHKSFFGFLHSAIQSCHK